MMRRVLDTTGFLLVGLLLAAGVSTAARADAAIDALIDRYVGTWDVEAFLAEPAIQAELHALLGATLERVMENLYATAGVEYYGSGLLVSGNAAHAGGEEEAIVCVQPSSGLPQVHVGVHSKGRITLYSRHEKYEHLPTCIKDWVGLTNARHAHRLQRPQNVRLVNPELRTNQDGVR